MAMSITKLAYGLGADIEGIDLRKPVDDDTIAGIRRAWLDNLVVIFRGQELTIEEHIAFSRNFGTLECHPVSHTQIDREHPEILDVTNQLPDGSPSRTAYAGREWHSDGAYSQRPPTGSLLYCNIIPKVGGSTWFSNMYMAYDTLSDGMKSLIDGLEVVNDVMKGNKFESVMSPKEISETRSAVPPVVQPLVRVHPETGRRALYLNERVTTQIAGMTIEESQGILDYLFAHSVRPEFTFRMTWQPNDLLFWDNRCVMHLALADYDPTEHRSMRRTTLLGEPLGRLYRPFLNG